MARHIPETFINDLLLRVDIVDVIDHRVPLRKTGANLSGLCPFHTEKTPSFTVSPAKQFYHCFGCGKHGNAIGFLMELDRLEFVEAVEQLAAIAGVAVPYSQERTQQQANQHQSLYELMLHAQEFYTQQLGHSRTAQQYLRQRGLNQQTIHHFKLGYAPAGWSQLLDHFNHHYPGAQNQLVQCGLVIRNDEGKTYDRFRDRILFPIFNRKGQIVGFGGRVLGEGLPKYLNSPESPIYHKGTGDLYGLYHLLQHSGNIPHILIVEGYMDLIALVQHGVTHVVATLGTATTRQHLERLFRYTKKLIFCFDGDSAGRQAGWRALENILPLMQDGHQAKFLFLPEGEDPDSIIRQEGVHNFNLRIDKAKPLVEFLFQELRLKTDPTTLDGRAALSQLAVPLLQKIPPGAYQQLMAEELARQVRIDNQKIQSLITEQPINQGVPHLLKTPQRKIPMPRLSPIERALSYLIQYPQIARSPTISTPYYAETLPATHQLLLSMMEFIKANPHANTATLLQHWQGTESASILSQLVIIDHILPFVAMEQEFKEILKSLSKNTIELQIEALMLKASHSTLKNEEKIQLQQLIVQSKESLSS